MKLFHCSRCAQRLYFENTRCTRCQAELGFCPDRMALLALEREPAQVGQGGTVWQDLRSGDRFRRCDNGVRHDACNWLVPATAPDALCAACRLNRTIPDLSQPGHRDRWNRLETAKRRLLYSLLRLNLPCNAANGVDGLTFDFLADQPASFSERGRVLTGHAGGRITINVAEADPVERERLRDQMDEPYRTVLGHFRHESGHYYWDRLIPNGPWLDDIRWRFGDDRQDYASALDRYYRNGPPPDWPQAFVSAYAASHPWEDWAETWAHYLHMVDTLETAWQFGLTIDVRDEAGPSPSESFDPYTAMPFDALIARWLPLTQALNSLNRSMGHDDAYPFVLAGPAIDKLHLVHDLIHQSG
ncbi:zinc-binding metallopeptidase family protein [Marinobacter sp. C2H3]|uniref:zinc-binding metallopeptidase family protein n=1 Tax=Marinobacter sp. C2H3 TaxID=3119003 RepID=UPI00300E94FD